MKQPANHSDTVHARLMRRAESTPHAIAFQHRGPTGGWQALDWAGFMDKVGALRCGMAKAGLKRGDRLALVAPVSLAWELVHHASLSMGVSVVGLDAHDLPDRLAMMFDQADVTAFAVADAGVLSGLSVHRIAAIRLAIDLGGADSQWSLDLARMSIQALTASGHGCLDPPQPGGDDEATVIFTSGTTGAPKGIAYSHGQLGLAIDAISDAFAFVGADGKLLCWLPLSSLFQRVVNLAAVQNGACTYLLGDPRQVMDHVAQVAPDVFVGVPRFFEKLHDGLQARIGGSPAPLRALLRWAWRVGHKVRECRRSGRPVPSALVWQHKLAERFVLRRIRSVMGPRLRCLVSGSAPMALNLQEDFEALGWPMLQAYGLSENVLPMAMNRLDDRRPGTVGRPLPGNDIVIGADALVRVRGPGVFKGYLGDVPGSTLDAEGYHLTGDLGSLDSDGFLHLTGRLGDLIKTSTGRRVAPAAVEAVLQAVIGVDQALLLGAGRKYLVALCTCSSDMLQPARWPRLQQSIQLALERVAPHERPAGVLVVDQPFSVALGELTPNLKLRRDAIAQRRTKQIDWLCTLIDQRGIDAAATPLVAAASAEVRAD